MPKVMLRPESARMMKQVAVIQCTMRSNALKRTSVRPDRPPSIRTMPRNRKNTTSSAEHAENRDSADPFQRHLVEFPPLAPARLLDDIGLGVGDACRGPVLC